MKKRLRRTLNYVAHTTQAEMRLEEITSRRSRIPTLKRQVPGVVVAFASFAGVLLVAAVPLLLLFTSPDETAQSFPPPVESTQATTTTTEAEVTTTIEPETDETSTEAAGPMWVAADRAWCLFSPTGTPGTSGPVPGLGEGPVGESVYSEWCRTYGTPDGGFTVCRGVLTEDVYEDAFAGWLELVAGDLQVGRPGFPVVLAWEAECDSQELTTSPSITLDSKLSYEQITQVREIEIEMRSFIGEKCLTRSESTDLATDVRTRLGDGWLLVRETAAPPIECGGIDIDMELGAVFLSVAQR